MFSETTATRKVLGLSKRIRGVQGGSSASKTISILLVLIGMAQSDETPTITSIVSESVPHLKRGALRDFKNIMQTHGYWKDSRWNATDSIYTYETGSIIEFFSTDNGDKLRGARRDRLFMNEANNCPLEAFEQLEMRTKQFVFLDWNPSDEFWFYTEILNKRTDVEHIILTYLDNEALDARIRESLEQRKNRKSWWQVYGLGQLGEVEGKIYTGWTIVDEVPKEAKLMYRGLDFGYSNDPTAIVDIWSCNGAYYLDEKAYRPGLMNRQIAEILSDEPNVLTIADSSEPKSIDEISEHGINIIGAVKGPDSVLYGIKKVQELKIFVTARSVNVIKEYRNYLWEVDKNGKITKTPEHEYSHAMDAIRYGFSRLGGSTKERAKTLLQTLAPHPMPTQNLTPEQAYVAGLLSQKRGRYDETQDAF